MANIADIRSRLDGGLIPAVPVPFDGQGKFHEQAQASYLNHMAAQAVAGVAVWAHTGRGLLLDDPTAQRVLQDWRNALAKKVVIAGVGSLGGDTPERATVQTVEKAESAARLGADALLVYPPTWLREHPQRLELIVEYHRRVAEIGLPLILFFLYEAAGGITYNAVELDELLALPEVVGIKMATLDSVMTYQDVSRQLLTRHPDKLLITGEDRFLGYSLRLGARAALIGMGAVCSDLQVELIRAHLEENAARFLALSDALDMLAESIFVSPMEGYIKRLLWVLVHQGVIPMESANDAWGPSLSSREFADLGRTLAALPAIQELSIR